MTFFHLSILLLVVLLMVKVRRPGSLMVSMLLMMVPSFRID